MLVGDYLGTVAWITVVDGKGTHLKASDRLLPRFGYWVLLPGV
ncbi:MAG TPA: hypothetical protein VMW00_06390 [Dehalococcoidales bacterium]|nr:hypothetical protein [Dehalococcoidales bacterium]